MDLPYFKIRHFTIYNDDSKQEIIIDSLLKDFIKSQKYMLQTNKDIHYDPDNFFDFLKLLSSKYPNEKFHVYYKYEYYNHDHINTYMNQLNICNSIIQDKLMSKNQ